MTRLVKNIFFFQLCILLLNSCSEKKEDINSRFDLLSQFYSDTCFREIYVYSNPSDSDSGFIFKGIRLNSSAINLLNETASKNNMIQEYYGSYSFRIDEQYTGLLTRTPGEYTSSAISLLIFDRKSIQLVKL